MTAIGSHTPSTNSLWQRWYTVKDDASPAERRFNAWFAVVIPIGVLIHAFFIMLFAYWEVWPMALVNVFSVLIWVFCAVVWRKDRLSLALALASALGSTGTSDIWRKQRLSLVLLLVAFEVYAHATLGLIMVGWGFGAQYFMYPLIIAFFLLSWWPRWLSLGMLAVTSITFVLYYFYAQSFSPMYTVPSAQLSILYTINTLTSFLVIALASLYIVAETERAEIANENLLTNVLPKPIAARLKKKEPTIADGFPNASILFADLTGFTRLSLKLKPNDLVKMLDTIFSRFDELVDKYGLEKIKTIGDEYMVASGIPIPREDHAEALANFALAMRDSLAEYSAANDVDLQMRIGLNSGPVVAGVIGKRRFLYDLWGDSVNTASRMESHGIPGEIQVSEATRDLLDDQFTFIDRGVIDIKGKGPMQTYLLQPNGRA
jgi:adenylate cyclase